MIKTLTQSKVIIFKKNSRCSHYVRSLFKHHKGVTAAVIYIIIRFFYRYYLKIIF